MKGEERQNKVKERNQRERQSKNEGVKTSMHVLHAHVTLVSWSLMEEQTQISPQGPALYLSLLLSPLAQPLPLFPPPSLSSS